MRVAYISPIDKNIVEELREEYAALKQHKGDAGLDLFTTLIHILSSTRKLHLGYTLVIVDHESAIGCTPISYMLLPRSSTPAKYGIIQTNSVGVVDAGYRGELSVPITSYDLVLSSTAVQPYTRMFQAVPFDGKGVDCVEVVDDDLGERFPSGRGIEGFGSTGV